MFLQSAKRKIEWAAAAISEIRQGRHTHKRLEHYMIQPRILSSVIWRAAAIISRKNTFAGRFRTRR